MVIVSESSRRKISETLKRKGIKPPSRKGCKMPVEAIQRIINTKRIKGNIYHSKEQIIKTQKSRKLYYDRIGRISPIYKLIKRSFKYKQWRQQVFLRDNFTCQSCKNIGGKLNAHHKNKLFSQLLKEIQVNLPLLNLYDGAMIYSPLWDIDNGITYCRECHKKYHKNGYRNE